MTLRTYCVLSSGNTAMNKTKSFFSWSFLSRTPLAFSKYFQPKPYLNWGLPKVQDSKSRSVRSDHSQKAPSYCGFVEPPLLIEFNQTLSLEGFTSSLGPRGTGHPLSWILLITLNLHKVITVPGAMLDPWFVVSREPSTSLQGCNIIISILQFRKLSLGT